jgi:hypothetical protein
MRQEARRPEKDKRHRRKETSHRRPATGDWIEETSHR